MWSSLHLIFHNWREKDLTQQAGSLAEGSFLSASPLICFCGWEEGRQESRDERRSKWARFPGCSLIRMFDREAEEGSLFLFTCKLGGILRSLWFHSTFGQIKCAKTVGLYLWCLKVLHTLSVGPQPSLISAAQSLSSCSGCATVVNKFWRPSHKLFYIIYRVASELTLRINNWGQGRAQMILACQRYFGIGLMCPVYMEMLL